MKLLMIAGLGNPGEEYTLTRHNAGADYVKLLCDKKSLALKKEKQINGSFAELTTEKYKLIFVIPSTYMNESGLSVAKSKKFFNLETDQILIAHDELDLPISEIRLKESGGHGGHNGLRNIIDHLQGDNSFKRLRIGIGKPKDNMEVSDFVLQNFDEDEMVGLEKITNNITESISILIEKKLDLFSSTVNNK